MSITWLPVETLIANGVRMPMALLIQLQQLEERGKAGVYERRGRLVLALPPQLRNTASGELFDALIDQAAHHDYDSMGEWYEFDLTRPRRNPARSVRRPNPVRRRAEFEFVGRDGGTKLARLDPIGAGMVRLQIDGWATLGQSDEGWFVPEIDGRAMMAPDGLIVWVDALRGGAMSFEPAERRRREREAADDPTAFLAKYYGMPLFVALTEALA